MKSRDSDSTIGPKSKNEAADVQEDLSCLLMDPHMRTERWIVQRI